MRLNRQGEASDRAGLVDHWALYAVLGRLVQETFQRGLVAHDGAGDAARQRGLVLQRNALSCSSLLGVIILDQSRKAVGFVVSRAVIRPADQRSRRMFPADVHAPVHAGVKARQALTTAESNEPCRTAGHRRAKY